MPDRETLAQQIRELTRLIDQVSGYDSILCTHNMRITSRNSGPVSKGTTIKSGESRRVRC